jgi:uncharacterized DUF497 family protein
VTKFVWDSEKELGNIQKHRVDFQTAVLAFDDPHRRLMHDSFHSSSEERFFCFGKVAGKVLTVRFTYREQDIRIIGAGYWRKGKNVYEKKNH